MEVKLLTVEIRPELCQYFEEQAKVKGISISRYVVKLLEMMQCGKEDKVVPYSSKEALDVSIREAEKDIRNGRGKTFGSAEEMFAALAEEPE